MDETTSTTSNSDLSQSPQSDPSELTQTQDETTSTTSNAKTYLADDVTNQPTGEVEQTGPVTYQADHVPSDAVPLLSTKVVAAPPAEPAAPAAARAETA